MTSYFKKTAEGYTNGRRVLEWACVGIGGAFVSLLLSMASVRDVATKHDFEIFRDEIRRSIDEMRESLDTHMDKQIKAMETRIEAPLIRQRVTANRIDIDQLQQWIDSHNLLHQNHPTLNHDHPHPFTDEMVLRAVRAENQR